MRPLYVFILCLLAFQAAAAQPAEVNRVLRTIDFEERRLNNPEDLPMHWSKVEGPGLMHYVNGHLSTARAHGGKYSFQFDLNGGGLVYRYDPKEIPVQPGAHYRVEGFVQTTVLPRARARLSAYFTDVDGHPLKSSLRHSDLYAAAAEGDPWQKLSVELSAVSEPAERIPNGIAKPRQPAFLVIELGLLQPMHYAATTLGQRTLHTQDIYGTAWFDGLTVAQVPRVTMTTDRPGNIFRRSEEPKLNVLVNDRFTDDLAAQLVVRDAAGHTVFQRSGALDMSAADVPGPGIRRMSLLLPDLPAGWYEAALVMTSQGQFVGEQTLDLVRLGDDAPRVAPDGRFGIIATDLPFDGWSELPDILPLLSAGRVKLAVWSEAGDIQQIDSAAFDRLLERLGALGITPTACLLGLPPQVREKLAAAGGNADPAPAFPKGREATSAPPENEWLQILTAGPELWQPQLAFLISRHANHLDRWQLGADGSDAFVTEPRMRDVYARVYREFAALVENPDLAMPWPAWYELDGERPATVALSVPASVLPSQLPLYMQDIGKVQEARQSAAGASSLTEARTLSSESSHQPSTGLSLSLELLDRRQYGREVQIRDLAQRVTYALAAGASRIDVPLPFAARYEGDVLVKRPQEMLLVLRTLITTLSGATFKGKVPIAESVEAFLFDRSGIGVIVLWDAAAGPGSGVKQLTLNLGRQPVRVDLWGNVSPLVSVGRGAAGERTVGVELGPMPILLVGVDGPGAQLRASVAMDRPLLESSFQPHTRRIRFVNPYPQAIAGTLKLRAPAGWTLNPPTSAFNLNPGELFERELTIEFPYNSFAGAKTLMAEFIFQGEAGMGFIAPIPLQLGLTDVGMQTLALREGDDVMVQQIITNYGDEPIDYTAFAIYPGQARQERLVTNLGAGRTTIKRYRFESVGSAGQVKVRSGVKELVGTRILNEEIAIQ
jgi:hypothetical protein